MRLPVILAAPFACAFGLPAAAQPSSDRIDDWRRGMACEAHLAKLADENERGYKSFLAAARRDPSLRDKAAEVARSEPGNVRLKRGFAASARKGADTVLERGYPAWRAADPALPEREALVRKEEAAAQSAAAKPRNVHQLMAAIDGLSCEDLLAPTG